MRHGKQIEDYIMVHMKSDSKATRVNMYKRAMRIINAGVASNELIDYIMAIDDAKD